MYKWFILWLWTSVACAQTDDKSPQNSFEKFLGQVQNREFDLLIQGGQILDGAGGGAFPADVLIQRDTVSFIGVVDTALIRCGRIISASGKLITPGFIDMHAHGNPLQEENFANFLAQGVTTICLGMDGTSPVYDRLEEWFALVNQKLHGVNIVPFVGHGTIRLLTGSGYKTSLTKDDLNKMTTYLDQALYAGCFGLSTGLEYTPGYQAQDEELLALARVVGTHDGLITSHLRNEDDQALESSIQELARQGKYARVNISHFKSVYGKGRERGILLRQVVDSLRRSGVTLTTDIYPYTASFTGISILFPEWAKPPFYYQQVLKTRRQELVAYLHQKVMSRNGPQATLLGTKPYVGKTLADLANEQNRPFAEVLAEMGPGSASAAYFVMDETVLKTLLEDSLTMVCSDGSPDMFHPRGYGSFTKIIQEYVLKDSVLSLAQAVHKMTGLSAQTLRLSKRGILKAGYYADLTVFDPTDLEAKATFVSPHQNSQGMSLVIVNGKIAWEKASVISLNGKLLLKK